MKKSKKPTRTEAKHCSGCKNKCQGKPRNEHNCRLTRLKDMVNIGTPESGFFLFSQHLNTLQAKFPDGDCIEVASTQRGTAAEVDGEAHIYDVATYYKLTQPQLLPAALRKAFLAIVGEKAFHEASAFDVLLDGMVEAGRISKEDADKARVDPMALREEIYRREKISK